MPCFAIFPFSCCSKTKMVKKSLPKLIATIKQPLIKDYHNFPAFPNYKRLIPFLFSHPSSAAIGLNKLKLIFVMLWK